MSVTSSVKQLTASLIYANWSIDDNKTGLVAPSQRIVDHFCCCLPVWPAACFHPPGNVLANWELWLTPSKEPGGRPDRQVVGDCVHAGLQRGFKFIPASVQQNVAIGGAEVLRVEQHLLVQRSFQSVWGSNQLTGLLGVSGHYNGSDGPKHGVGLRCVCVCVLTLILSLDNMKDYRGKSLPLWPSDPGLTGSR